MPDFDRLLRALLEEGALPARPDPDDLVPWLPMRPQTMGEAVGASLPQLDDLEAEWFGPAPEGEPQLPRRPHQLGFVEQAFGDDDVDGDAGGGAGERMPRWQAFADPYYRPFSPAVMLTPPEAHAQERAWPQSFDELLPAGTDAEPALRAAYAALPAQAAGGLPLATGALEQVSMRGAVTELDLSQVEGRLVELISALSATGAELQPGRVREDRRTERLGGVNADVHDGMRQRTGGRDVERYLR